MFARAAKTTHRRLTMFVLFLLVLATAVALPITRPAPAHAINVCHTVIVQKKLPWYQCINLRPGTLLPAACYGDVTKVVCSQ